MAVEGANDSGYIHPPKYRDRYVNISNYSGLLLLPEVRDWLSVDEQAIFKGTAIGHLLLVPEDSKFSGSVVHFLLSREIHMDDKPDEMHFKVGGKVLHFGKREFALITGLSFKKPEKDFISPPNSSSLMRTYFPNQNRVSGSKVKDLLSKRNSTCSSLDKVKLALLLVVHKFLMGRPDRDTINISYWHLVDDLEEFNKYPWGEATFGKIAKFRSPLLYQANKENSGAGGECYKVVGIAHALLVWALDIMPGLLNLCGRKIESRGWQPHMLCVLCTRSPEYPRLIRTLEVNDVHVLSDIMWQKGDANQLLVLGLEEGTTELSSFIWTEKERHEYHGESSQRDSFHETEDCNQDHEVPDAASVLLSKKRKVSTEENECGTSMKDSHSKDVHKGNMSSCSREKTTRTETLEVDISPFPPGFTRASVQERVEGFERVDNLKIPEEYVILYKKIYEKHGHMATKKVIKFNDAMLLTCVTSLLKIISAMEYVRGSELSEALLERWEGFIKDAESLEFNIKWLRKGFNRLRYHWRSSFGIDTEIESHIQVLDVMQVRYDGLLTREDELNAELSKVKIQKRKAEAAISCELIATQEKLTQKIKFKNEVVLGLVLS
ncbi:uncharacterized protein LOC113307826 [Papaver somniferum]|uniref:uncharacterized protein LOC113307826 n=1 Tax=Papaver somniferum TaxID=3469 RepID=UPI000E70067F|nr:uncharacterized protein LOC113307826 [Papaver somniferum]